MTAAQKKAWFLNEYSWSNGDKWVAINDDDSEQKLKHVYGGAVQVANMINWELVKVASDNEGAEPIIFEI